MVRRFGALFLMLGIGLILGFGWWVPLGEVAFALHPPALSMVQAVVQRHLAPWLWDFVLLPVLLVPAWIPPMGLGGLLVAFSGRRDG